jgi:hypothetical protein
MGDALPKMRITSVPFARGADGTLRTSSSRIEIDGVDISNIVTKVDVAMQAGRVTKATVEIVADAIEIDTELFEIVRPHIAKNSAAIEPSELVGESGPEVIDTDLASLLGAVEGTRIRAVDACPNDPQCSHARSVHRHTTDDEHVECGDEMCDCGKDDDDQS